MTAGRAEGFARAVIPSRIDAGTSIQASPSEPRRPAFGEDDAIAVTTPGNDVTVLVGHAVVIDERTVHHRSPARALLAALDPRDLGVAAHRPRDPDRARLGLDLRQRIRCRGGDVDGSASCRPRQGIARRTASTVIRSNPAAAVSGISASSETLREASDSRKELTDQRKTRPVPAALDPVVDPLRLRVGVGQREAERERIAGRPLGFRRADERRCERLAEGQEGAVRKRGDPTIAGAIVLGIVDHAREHDVGAVAGGSEGPPRRAHGIEGPTRRTARRRGTSRRRRSCRSRSRVENAPAWLRGGGIGPVTGTSAHSGSAARPSDQRSLSAPSLSLRAAEQEHALAVRVVGGHREEARRRRCSTGRHRQPLRRIVERGGTTRHRAAGPPRPRRIAYHQPRLCSASKTADAP